MLFFLTIFFIISLPLFFFCFYYLSTSLFFCFCLYYSIPHSFVVQFFAMTLKMSSPEERTSAGMSSSLLVVSMCLIMRIRSSAARFLMRAGESQKVSPRAAESSSISARVGFVERLVVRRGSRGSGAFMSCSSSSSLWSVKRPNQSCLSVFANLRVGFVGVCRRATSVEILRASRWMSCLMLRASFALLAMMMKRFGATSRST